MTMKLLNLQCFRPTWPDWNFFSKWDEDLIWSIPHLLRGLCHYVMWYVQRRQRNLYYVYQIQFLNMLRNCDNTLKRNLPQIAKSFINLSFLTSSGFQRMRSQVCRGLFVMQVAATQEFSEFFVESNKISSHPNSHFLIYLWLLPDLFWECQVF